MKYDYMIIGAGFSGAVCAERLAANGNRVLVIDKRDHIGGNAFDKYDEHGVLIHPYGPHIFHTNSKRVIEYLSKFTDWRFYEHRVLASVDGQLLPIPINRTTVNSLYKLDLTEDQVEDFFRQVRVVIEKPQSSEDVVLSSVGRELCEKFFRGYTKKQWGLDLSQLAAGVAARIPVRSSDDDRYFSDTFQFIPVHGYGTMFSRMLSHENIEVKLSTEFEQGNWRNVARHLIYTGPIDSFYAYCHGKLPYRSLRFEHTHIAESNRFQSVGTVNYPNTEEFTRITEFKHITGQEHSGTSIVKEYPTSEGDPYYPIPREENSRLYRMYQETAQLETDISFVGRLAEYKYYNMDQVVAASLKLSSQLLGREQ